VVEVFSASFLSTRKKLFQVPFNFQTLFLSTSIKATEKIRYKVLQITSIVRTNQLAVAQNT
jgi:hypothetical protein